MLRDIFVLLGEISTMLRDIRCTGRKKNVALGQILVLLGYIQVTGRNIRYTRIHILGDILVVREYHSYTGRNIRRSVRNILHSYLSSCLTPGSRSLLSVWLSISILICLSVIIFVCTVISLPS